jgi:hypothetical protein
MSRLPVILQQLHSLGWTILFVLAVAIFTGTIR